MYVSLKQPRGDGERYVTPPERLRRRLNQAVPCIRRELDHLYERGLYKRRNAHINVSRLIRGQRLRITRAVARAREKLALRSVSSRLT